MTIFEREINLQLIVVSCIDIFNSFTLVKENTVLKKEAIQMGDHENIAEQKKICSATP